MKSKVNNKPEPDKNSAKIVATNDVRLISDNHEDYSHNIFEIGETTIKLTHSDKCEYGKFGWENIPQYDTITGYDSNLKTFWYTTEASKHVHPTWLYPADPNHRIKLFGIEFIHHQPVQLMTPGGIYYVKLEEGKVVGRKYKSFKLPVNVDYFNFTLEDINVIADKLVEEAIWELLKNGFSILHWNLNNGVKKAKEKRDKSKANKNVATKKQPYEGPAELSEKAIEKLLPANGSKKEELVSIGGDPRTHMMKFRLSLHTRSMLSQLTIEKEKRIGKHLSIADVIHFAIKEMASTMPEVFTQEELNNII